jgi:hypothetical protein
MSFSNEKSAANSEGPVLFRRFYSGGEDARASPASSQSNLVIAEIDKSNGGSGLKRKVSPKLV